MFVLPAVIKANRAGRRSGICSICSANPFVLETAMAEARECGRVVCIESTSNQVNQFGGYSGMTAADFVRLVRDVASETGFPYERILLGGDHLGPHPWQDEPAESAMEKASELVRSCVLSGYTKIHLDASMRCADDPGGKETPLAERMVTRRAAELCRVAEDAHASRAPGSPAPYYVIGTDVPPPGGEKLESKIWTTSTESLERTVALTREVFFAMGLEAAWERVVAIVVQPGVEFGDTSVFEYDRERTRALSSCIRKFTGLVFEAHSTDYQTRVALRQMVEDHFAILKVGPWLTFAFREAVFALEVMEREWLGGRRGVRLSGLQDALENAMIADPRHWQNYYHGGESDIRFARKYSFSDRSRYYWPNQEVQQALRILLANLAQSPVPLALLSQFMPEQYEAVREERISISPRDLIRSRIALVLGIYADACGTPTIDE